jgi:hypothetical protein
LISPRRSFGFASETKGGNMGGMHWFSVGILATALFVAAPAAADR